MLKKKQIQKGGKNRKKRNMSELILMVLTGGNNQMEKNGRFKNLKQVVIVVSSIAALKYAVIKKDNLYDWLC